MKGSLQEDKAEAENGEGEEENDEEEEEAVEEKLRRAHVTVSLFFHS